MSDVSWRGYWESPDAKVHGETSDESFDNYAGIVTKHLLPKKGELILDVGCGEGSLTNRIKDRSGANLVGVDFSENLLKKARKKDATITWIQQDALKDFPFKSGSFDKIFSFSFLQYIPNNKVKHLIRECKRILKNGDANIITHLDVPNKSKIRLFYKSPRARAMLLFYRIFRNGNTPGIGYWFTEKEIKRIAKELGLDVEIKTASYYRFHLIFKKVNRN